MKTMHNHLKEIQKQNSNDPEYVDPRYLDNSSNPETVMFRMQGPLRLDKPLKSDGSSDVGDQSC